MVVEFKKMVFRKKRIKRNYPIGDVYEFVGQNS